MAFSLCIIPAHADPLSSVSFKNWVNAFLDATSPVYSFWHNLFGSSASDTAYSDYVSSLPATIIDSSGTGKIHLNWSVLNSNGITLDSNGSTSYPYFSGLITNSSNFVALRSSLFTVSTTTTFVFHVDAPTAVGTTVKDKSSSGSNNYCYVYSSDYNSITSYDYHYTASLGSSVNVGGGEVSVSLSSGSYFIYFPINMNYPSSGTSVSVGFNDTYLKVSSVASVFSSSDYSASTRAGSLAGDFFTTGDDGSQTTFSDSYIVNEGAGTLTVGGTTYNMSDWTYDYSTRTYDYTTDDSHTGKIVYGDDSASVTMTDSTGNTVTYNYYYGVASSSGGSTDSGGSGTTGTTGTVGGVFGSLMQLLSSINGVISSAVSAVGSVLTSLITAIGNIFSGIFNLFNNLNTFVFGDSSSQGATDFYNSPSTFSGGSVWV